MSVIRMELPRWLHTRLWGWSIAYRVHRPMPDVTIGTDADPYLRRWWVIPRNALFNVYLHEFWRSDDDRALHDHPWVNLSLVLAGGYYEITPKGRFWRGIGTMKARLPWSRHRVELDVWPVTHRPVKATTLFLTGPRIRAWGFWCPQGWVHWRQFTDPGTGGATIGKGCE